MYGGKVMETEFLPANKTPGLHARPFVHLLIIIALGFLAYSNTFHGPIQWDGVPYIIENPVMKDVGNFISSTQGYNFNPRRFIGNLTFALNYSFGGESATGYHIVNFIIHVSSALLVYFLIVLTFQTPAMSCIGQSAESRAREDTPCAMRYAPSANLIALFSALLFVAHPLQTQAVTYIYQRYTSLATLFYLLCLVLYIKGRVVSQRSEVGSQKSEGQGKEADAKLSLAPVILYVLAVLSAVLAMKTKEIAFTLPLVVSLYEFTFFKVSLRKKLLVLVPIVLTLIVVPLSVLQSDQTVGELLADVDSKTRLQTDMPRWDYVMTELRVIVTYIRLLVFPISQNADYDYPLYHSLLTLPVFLSFLFLLSLFGSGIYLLYASRSGKVTPFAQAPFLRLIGFGIIWFFVTLSVESSFIPISDVIFEHRVYLPSIGFFVVATTGLLMAAERFTAHKIVIPALCLVIAALSFATYSRNSTWTDMTRLWSDTVKKSPSKTRARYNLAQAYYDQGRMAEALREYQIAVDVHLDDPEARYNLGTAYLKQQHNEEAIQEFQKALALKPDYAHARNNLGTAYLDMGRINDAVREFKAAIDTMPDYADAHFNLGSAYFEDGRLDEALNELRSAAALAPYNPETLSMLGNVYWGMERLEDAVREFRAGLKLDPGVVDMRFNLGIVYMLQERIDEAVQEFETVARFSPDNPALYNNLGAAYFKQGRIDDAIRTLQRAADLNPDDAEIRRNLDGLVKAVGMKKER